MSSPARLWQQQQQQQLSDGVCQLLFHQRCVYQVLLLNCSMLTGYCSVVWASF
jgi:hypothetical protein